MEHALVPAAQMQALRVAQPRATSAPQMWAQDPRQEVLAIHRIIGNRGVGRLLQAKLIVRPPNDEYEQEADRIAERVMRMPERHLQVQRQCACDSSSGPEEECEECKLKHLALQRRSMDREAHVGVPPIVFDVLRSPGRPMDPDIRVFMESRFRRDFTHVRVHTDAQAAKAAGSVNALAFTVGSDLVFGHHQYSPESSSGRRLLAHELVHVVQQGTPRFSSSGGSSDRASDDGSAGRGLQRSPAVPAWVGAALAAVGRLLLACIIGAAFGVGIDYAFQRGAAWWRNRTFVWNTCYALVSGVIGCVSGIAGGIIARALFRGTGGHLETGAVKAVVWVLTWLYSKFPVVPIAIILKQLVKLGCVDRSELPPGVGAE